MYSIHNQNIVYRIFSLFLILHMFSDILHKGSWRLLRAESCALRERALALGSWDNRVSHLRQYVTFTTYFGVPDFPLHLGILLRFIALLGRSLLAYGSAVNILSSLKWFASILDPLSAKVCNAVLVSVTMKGLKAQFSRPLRQKLPFTADHLCKFYECLDLSNSKYLSCWCAMLLAFFGCFRLSNLVPVSKNRFDPLKQLKRDDIKFENNVVLIFYKWAKTNQNCNRVAWVPLCSLTDG